MALLAYDPERVGCLRSALGEALTGLRAVTCSDPAAREAMRAVRATAMQLDTAWLPLVTRLLASDPLSSGQRRAAQITALEHSLVRVMVDGYGWSAQTDPLHDDAGVVTTEEARALGAMLNQIDPEALANDREQLAWLAQQLLVIGGDPTVSANFLANFHRWDVLTMTLGRQRANSFGAEHTGATVAADLDPVFDGLMSIWQTGGTTGLLPVMDSPDPYIKALMLRSLHLDPMALATAANELLRGWLDTKETFGSGSVDLAVVDGPNAADLLLQGVADSPKASAFFLSLILDRPALLMQTLNDPEIGYRIALAGTDPTRTSSPVAGRAVLAILDYFRSDPYKTALSTDGSPGDFGPFLGQLVAPWLLQFTGANDEWAADDFTKAQLLGVAVRDDAALDELVAASQRIASGFANTLITSRHDDAAALELSLQVGGLLSLLGQLVVDERVDDENDRSHFLWDVTWTVLAAATNFVPGGAAANVVAGLGVTALEGMLADVFIASRTDEVRHDGEYTMDAVLTIAASVMLLALVQSWQADGRLDPMVPPPPSPSSSTQEGCPSSAYRDDVEQWARQLPGGATGILGLTATNLVGNFIGRPQADEHCAELTH